MVKLIENKELLIDSLATMVEVKNKKELIDIIVCWLSEYDHGLLIDDKTVEIKPYGFDKRTNWDTHIVTLKDYGVVGFTDSEVPL